MKNSVQPLIIFLIPLLLAILLTLFGNYIYAPDESAVKFVYDEYIPLQKTIYYSLTVGLFLLSLLLPTFIALRSERVERTELNLKDI